MVVWGGFGTFYLNDGGIYDPATNSWSGASTTNAPEAREYHTAVWTGTKMIIWGGMQGCCSKNTGGRLG